MQAIQCERLIKQSKAKIVYMAHLITKIFTLKHNIVLPIVYSICNT